MQSLIAFTDSCRRCWRSLIAPTAVFVWVLHLKTTAQTPVGARISAMPKYVIASTYGNYFLKALVFDYFTAYFAARSHCFCFVMGKLFLLSKIFFDLRKGIAVAQDAAAVLEADEVHADENVLALIVKSRSLKDLIDKIRIRYTKSRL